METITNYSAKRNVPIILPLKQTSIFQNNNITNARYNCTFIQEKVFNAIMFYLQESIALNCKNQDFTQLSLWQEEDNNIYIKIPLKEITTPPNYDYARDAIAKFAVVPISIPYTDPVTKKPWVKISGLFEVHIPIENSYNSQVKISIKKDIAKILTEIDKDENGNPIKYTRYIYEIIQNSKKRYTPKIYKKLCSFRKKGGFYQRIDEFREWLNIEKTYEKFSDIKTNILVPSQKELFQRADCWFNCAAKDFIVRDKKKVIGLNWKVITPELIKNEETKQFQINNFLKNNFNFTDKDILLINDIFQVTTADKIMLKIAELNGYLNNDNKYKEIKNVTQYIIKSLKSEFPTN